MSRSFIAPCIWIFIFSLISCFHSRAALPDELASSEFKVEPIWDGITFAQAVSIIAPPHESDRVFVVEKRGTIKLLENLSNPQVSMFLDISSRITPDIYQDIGLLNMVFHPEFQSNGFFYLFYHTETTTEQGSGSHFRISRFSVDPTNPSAALIDSELILINQLDENPWHAGSAMEFGPDGYLYISVGDEGASSDVLENSQRIDKDFFSGIFRIDVDQRPENLPPNPHPAASMNYSIPADNPFVGATTFLGRPLDPAKVRTEFYAVGLRSPWRFSFDPLTGQLYCNDVGQNLFEEIDLILRGANYGWNFKEAFRSDILNRPPADDELRISLMHPLTSYGRSVGASLGGALVYRGHKFTELHGKYLFTEYVSGKIGFIDLPSSELRTRLEEVHSRIQELNAFLDTGTLELDLAQAEWEASPPEYWSILPPISTETMGTTLTRLEDD